MSVIYLRDDVAIAL